MTAALVSFCGVIGFIVAWALIPFLQRYTSGRWTRQFHQTHKTPISRVGGVALAAAFTVVAALSFLLGALESRMFGRQLTLIGTSLAMFGLGFWDDLKPIGAKRKLLGQVLIASIAYSGGMQIETLHNPFTGANYVFGLWGWPLTVLWLVSLTNLVNLIDGIDGLAAGICFMVMALLLVAGWHAGLSLQVICAAGMCGALLGFLCYNFPPAKIYMGDGGAYFLGYLIGGLSLVNSQKGAVVGALVAPLFVLALPIIDVTLAILRRSLKGLPIFRPDRQHLHHRLMQMGLSRTRVVLMFYSLSLVFLLLAFGVLASAGRWLPFLFGFLCLILLLSARSFSFSREWFAIGKVLGNSIELRKEARYALAMSRWLELEAERAPSPESLWADFTFFARKLGFSEVRLEHQKGWRVWREHSETPPASSIWRKRHDLNSAHAHVLEFVAGTDILSEKAMDLLSELAAEAWVKAAARWQSVNRDLAPVPLGASERGPRKSKPQPLPWSVSEPGI